MWADVVCAWAYIGKRRLAQALEGWDGEPVEVVWRPFRIDPMAPTQAEPMEEVLRDPVVDAALQGCAPGMTPAENRVRVSEIAAAEGLGSRWGAAWRASSHDAHRLIALAYQEGGSALQDAVLEGVLRAHFVEQRDISLKETLQEIAAAAGFSEGGRLLGEGGAEEYVRETLLRGKAIGVTTSPTLVIGGEALAGAHAPEVIAQFVARAVAEPRRELPTEVERLRLAQALLDKGDPLGCLTLLGKLMAEHPEERSVRLLAARAHYHSAQLSRARSGLETLVAEIPDDAYARLMLGRVLERQGKGEEAAPHLRIAAAMNPEYGKAG
ncbi:DSBA oxidoreductase [Streptomyces graminofaciens]|uniref:DSBA oxidoreductase n=1 Tax=Streptomyces graminofaciens TaxID=68212 RepID=A0ABN5VH06_9ACTN|nr:DSBA oxidoreductase [Streptomyces graminofaciens]